MSATGAEESHTGLPRVSAPGTDPAAPGPYPRLVRVGRQVATVAYIETDAILQAGRTDAVSDTRRPGLVKKAQELPVLSLDLVPGVVSRSGDLQNARLGCAAPGNDATRVVDRDGLVVPPVHQRDWAGDAAHSGDRRDSREAVFDQRLHITGHQDGEEVRQTQAVQVAPGHLRMGEGREADHRRDVVVAQGLEQGRTPPIEWPSTAIRSALASVA